MRPAGPLLLLLLAAASARDAEPAPTTTEPADAHNATIILDNLNGTVYIDSANHTVFVDNNNRTIILDDLLADGNDTVIEYDGEHEPIVRKKRTFGDIVFRGLADVLGYNVARKAPQVVFPPPLAPVPGIDTPYLVVPAAAVAAVPVVAQAVPAAPAAPAPCASGRAAPPPCRAAKPAPPPAPRAAPPCPRPKAAPRPKPKPKPAPPPPPPCPQPRAKPATPSPCAPAPAKQPPSAKQQADPNLETISSNFQLNFNFNRGPATQAPAAADVEDASVQEQEQADEQEQFTPIAIQPQAARLPAEEPRKPRVYVDAFVVRNGVPQRVDAVDAKRLDPQLADDDYLVYDDEDAQQDRDDYDDVQESRNQDNTIREFGNVIDRFWEKKKMMRRTHKMKVPMAAVNHYRDVHFGDRDLNDEIRLRGESHQSLQRERPHPNRIPLPEDDDAEATTTTEDPSNSLKPRVLPPTEHNPNQIDTITVRVPPIYREKRPRKLHRENYEPDYEGGRREYDDDGESSTSYRESSREDTDGDDTSYVPYTERPRRKRRRKHSRKTRSTDEKDDYKTDEEFDYFGKKVPVSDHEKYFMELTVPPPTRDADVLRHEKPVSSGYFLEDHERLKEDPSQRLRDDPSQKLRDDPSQTLKDDPSDRIRDETERVDSSERIDERERADDKERLTADSEREGDEGRTDDEGERSDKLSPNARVTESAYENKYVRATNVQVEDPRHGAPAAPARRRTGKARA